MTLRSKIFLLLSLLFFGLSYTPFGSETLYDIPKPLAAIFFGLFLITWIFPPRVFVQLDRDQSLRNKLIRDEKQRRRRRQPARSPSRWKPRPVHP